MPLADVLRADLARSLTIVGPGGGNDAPANVQARCGAAQRTVQVIQEAVMASVVIGEAVHGGATLTLEAKVIAESDAYWLSWNPWRAYIIQLGAVKQFFVTANLTGCGIIVAGDQAAPYVVHANCAAADVVDYRNPQWQSNGATHFLRDWRNWMAAGTPNVPWSTFLTATFLTVPPTFRNSLY